MEATRSDIRYTPSSFDADDAGLAPVARPAEWKWRSLESFLRTGGSHGLISRLPAFWQAVFPMHDACRATGIPLFVNDPENIPVGAAALDHGFDAVVCEAADIPAFAGYCTERNRTMPKAWFVIRRPGKAPVAHLPASGLVWQEVHALPGVPALAQCEHLARERQRVFHMTSESDSGVALHADDSPWTLPPDALRACGTCACGLPLVELVC